MDAATPPRMFRPYPNMTDVDGGESRQIGTTAHTVRSFAIAAARRHPRIRDSGPASPVALDRRRRNREAKDNGSAAFENAPDDFDKHTTEPAESVGTRVARQIATDRVGDEPECAVACVPLARCVSVAVAARAHPGAVPDIRGSVSDLSSFPGVGSYPRWPSWPVFLLPLPGRRGPVGMA